ncbi:hypothetical protein [Burkholderia pseudomallei]|uniref:hypothetical protein n=1 Tax=Burkholderia pseudomallei TaxID=28450 RepID=UPI0009E2E0CC|nr:hypothetical protein [Burkholderia pseudomallei]
MVIVFFCISGVLGKMRRHPSITTRDSEAAPLRSLDTDSLLFGTTIDSFPGVVVVVANDWPLNYGLSILRQECAPFGHRIVNSVKLVGGTKEDCILTFMASRSEPYAVVASSDFEFSEVTAEERVNVRLDAGFDDDAVDRLRRILEGYGEEAKRPLSADEVLSATVNNPMLRRMQKYVTASQAARELNPHRQLAKELSPT